MVQMAGRDFEKGCVCRMKKRRDALEAVAEQAFDVCVIGGGATGAGCALDAQLRGLKTVLLESGDFASAASSASTKLVHGGVRYLEQAVKKLNAEEYRMVEQALRERVHMLRNAPHLAHAAEFLVPVFSWIQAGYYRVGMKMYDWIAGKGNLFPSRFVSREETLKRMPGLRGDGLRGAVSYSDGQFDDARYNLSLVQTFAAAGGEALNYARVTGFAKDGSGRLTAAFAQDCVGQKDFTVTARAFVNATGPASDEVRRMASPGRAPRLRPSKGAHIIFALECFPGADALLVPKTEDGRVIFAVPWQGRLLVGTTDDEATPGTKMLVLREEAEYLLRQLNPYLAKPLSAEQVVSGFAGLRPLVAAGNGDTKELIRDHEVEVDQQSGLISILGGKWTTHRLMAEDTIDAVMRSLGKSSVPSGTRSHVLFGGGGYEPNYWKRVAEQGQLTEDTARHLASKFGTQAEEILRIAANERDLAKRLVPDAAPILAEVVYCARQEMAMSIEDVLARRLGLQLFDWRSAMAAAPAVGRLLAREHGWTTEVERTAVQDYTAKIRNFLEMLQLPVAAQKTS